jgi:protein O-mannosyl-transferase
MAIAALVLITVGLYLPTFRSGFIWDDADYVTANPWVRGTSTILDIWFSHSTPQYYPVTFTSFWLEHKLWGLDPAGYHVVNVLLHAADAVLLYLVMRALSRRLAFAVALVFAIHPIQVETVAWITERKNLLAVLFFLLAVRSWLRYETGRRPGAYAWSFVMFVLSLLSKSITVAFVAVPFLLKWSRRQRIERGDLVRAVPFCAAGAVAGLHTAWLEVHKVGAAGEDWALSLPERLLLPARIVLFYVGKIVVPSGFVFSYPRWPLDPGSPAQWAPAIVLVVALALLVVYRERVGRGAVAAFLFFIISLVPALGLFNVYPMRYSFVADHFAYLSSIPLIGFLLAAGVMLFDRFPAPAAMRARRAGRIAAGLVLGAGALVLSVVTVRHQRDFRDAETLWRHVIAKNPKSLLACTNLGLLSLERGQPDEATKWFDRGLEIDPHDAEIHNDLGIMMIGRDQPEAAMGHFQAALDAHPRYPNTYNNIATVYAGRGREDEAVRYYEKCVEVDPRFPQALLNLGRIHRGRGQADEAIGYFERAVDAQPGFIEARIDLGTAYAERGSAARAIREFTTARSLNPSDPRPWSGLASIDLRQGRVNAATAGFEEALRLAPDFMEAHYYLGTIERSQGRLDEAYEHFRKVKDLGGALEPDVDRFLEEHGRRK